MNKISWFIPICSAIISLTGCGGGSSSASTSIRTAGNLDMAGFNATGPYPGMVITNTDISGTSSFSQASATAIQGDGKIVSVGYASHNGHQQFAIVRYNTDGTLDTTGFGTNGIVNTSISSNCWATAVAIQADQRIVVAGYSNNGVAGSGNIIRFALARYNSNGSLDTSFGTIGDGTVISQLSTTDSEANSIAIQNDGMIVVAGYSVVSGRKAVAIARYTTAGVLDTGFGPTASGVFSVWLGTSADAQIFGLAIEPISQKIIAVGLSAPTSTRCFTVLKLTTLGALDTGFNTTGIVATVIGIDASAQAVALQSDGKIVAVGYANDAGPWGFAVARYNAATGALDPAFNPGGSKPGTLMTAIGSGNARSYAVAIQPSDQKVVVAGYYDKNGTDRDFALVRYNTNGSIDTGFGVGGIVTTQVGNGTDNEAFGIAIQSDGKFVVAGYSQSTITNFAMVRYLK